MMFTRGLCSNAKFSCLENNSSVEGTLLNALTLVAWKTHFYPQEEGVGYKAALYLVAPVSRYTRASGRSLGKYEPGARLDIKHVSGLKNEVDSEVVFPRFPSDLPAAPPPIFYGDAAEK